MNGAEYIIRKLISNGTETVFGYPGGTVLSVYDSLYRHRNEIRHIRASHEQGAAHAADGYARVSGRAGVCIATSGPGATNLVTGIANAYMDSVPVVFITGNVEHTLIGTDSFQEVDICGMTLGVTKHSWAVRDRETLIRAMNSAFRVAFEGRRGPVLIDVAKDILETDEKAYEEDIIRSADGSPLAEHVLPRSAGFREETRAAASLIGSSVRPLIIMGGGARRSGAENAVSELAKRLGAPVCATLMGTGAPVGVPENDWLGLPGLMAHPRLKRALELCDVIVAVGARLSNRVVDPAMFQEDTKKLVQIDTDRAEINKIVKADAFIEGDASEALKAVLELLPAERRKSWLPRGDGNGDFSGNGNANGGGSGNCDGNGDGNGDGKAVFPSDKPFAAALEAVKEAAGEHLCVCTDVGLHQLYTARLFPFGKNDIFVTSGGLGTMGSGLGAAIGAAAAAPDRTVLLITGDGGFMMDMNELEVVARERLPVIVIIMRNDSLGMVREMQKKQCGRRYSQTSLSRRVSFTKIAGAFGITGKKARGVGELAAAVREAREKGIPAVIEYRLQYEGC